ncbi:hypothetical protein [Bacillus paramycoides]|uniref:hypothetical protein n=1 Tax=Bacillus paramycoides TaxID=2026194 RepID=UPI002E20C136|nr:hypothetical protein [Bacillus paramycoides]
MPGILLTITNEQLKESINKLQEKVESFDTVKELQDKVISIQDHQISFLNDSIANMWQPIAIASGLIAVVFSGAFAYVAYLNKQAQNKVGQATEKMEEAQTKMENAEKALSKAEQQITNLEQKLQEADNIVNTATTVTNTAQEKLNELETEQKEINKLTSIIEDNQRLDMSFNRIKLILDLTKENIDSAMEKTKNSSVENLITLQNYDLKHNKLDRDYRSVSFDFSNAIVYKEKVTNEHKQKIEEVLSKSTDLFTDFFKYLDEIEEIENTTEVAATTEE